MEHRCSARNNANIKILIYQYGVPVAIGRIRNGTRHGLYIESDLSDVRPLQKLGIEILVYRRPQKLQRHKFAPIIIHITENGFRIAMATLNEETGNQITEMLRKSPATPKES